MADTESRRKILVVDDYPEQLTAISRAFEAAKKNNFSGWNIRDDVREVLQSMELTCRKNPLIDSKLDDIIAEIVKGKGGINGQACYSGIISDFSMPIGAKLTEHIADNDINLLLQQASQGGLQLAKMAKLLGIPLVIFSQAPEEAREASATFKFLQMNPAQAPAFSKNDYPAIFTSLAEQIIAQERQIQR